MCWARPDAPLLVAAAMLGLLHARPARWRCVLVIGAIAAVFVGTQLAFRLSYYGDWLPNTAHAKLGPSTHHLREGWKYLIEGLVASKWVVIAGAAGLLASTLPTGHTSPRSGAGLHHWRMGRLRRRYRRRLLSGPPALAHHPSPLRVRFHRSSGGLFGHASTARERFLGSRRSFL